MRIERRWGQLPGWLSTLDKETQVRLMAEDRILTTPKGGGAAPRNPKVQVANNSAADFWGV